ncbi:MAG TPA: serpin family protein [Chitinophagaceae bacterium]|nr:serpin family protein [Chitinophagaceae bacterium]
MLLKNKLVIACLLIITTGMISCSTTEQIPDPEIKPLPEQSQKTIRAQNNFAFKIFNLINQNNQNGKNKLISPLSIYMDLSMVYNGANHQTKKDIQKALQLNKIDTGLLNKTNAILLHNLPQEDTAVNIDIANAIWYRKSLTPLSSFLKINKNYYKATIKASPFNQSTVDEINNWVKDKTHHKIKSIIKEIQPSDLTFLLNAVYFKGDWTHQFDQDQTKKRTFHTKNQEELQVPFMYKKAKISYFENNDLQVAQLPYGSGEFNMFVLLPKEGKNVVSTFNHLNASAFSTLTSKVRSTEVKLYLPKWESEYKIDLNAVLSQMGMASAFSKSADFSNMYKGEDVQISEVKHKTYIKVDESGTEAAAVTSTGMTTTSAPMNPPSIPIMDVNHPFIYLITEKDSGSILFLGIVNNPKQ